MAHDPQMRLVAQDGLAMIAKVALKLKAMLLHKRTHSHMHQLWCLLLAVLILLHQELVALPILTVGRAHVPVSVDDPPARLDGADRRFDGLRSQYGRLPFSKKEPATAYSPGFRASLE